MSATQQLYNRVEFAADFGFGPIQAAFVDFSPKAISFGVPRNIQIYEGTPEEPSDTLAICEFHRVSVHANGRVETHWPVDKRVLPTALEEFDQNKPALCQWDMPSSWSFDLGWGLEYLKYMKPWFAKPKPPSPVHSTCLNVEVDFVTNAVRSDVRICIARHDADLEQLAGVIPLNGQVWCLNGGWPWVLVAMSNIEFPKTDVISTVGRDYR